MLTNQKILLVNDDGIKSPFLKNLYEELVRLGVRKEDILVVAPKKEQSAVSAHMHIIKPLVVKEYKDIYYKAYQVEGTPVDCVKFALCYLKFVPDLVISGINLGLNLGEDILYSGTIAAARDAAISGFLALALSAQKDNEHPEAALRDIYTYIKQQNLFDMSKVISVNIAKDSLGFALASQGDNPFDTRYEKRGNKYYCLGDALGKMMKQDDNSDVYLFHQGYTTISPLVINQSVVERKR